MCETGKQKANLWKPGLNSVAWPALRAMSSLFLLLLCPRPLPPIYGRCMSTCCTTARCCWRVSMHSAMQSQVTAARGLRQCISRVLGHNRQAGRQAAAAAQRQLVQAAASSSGEAKPLVAPPDVPDLARLAHIAVTEEEVRGPLVLGLLCRDRGKGLVPGYRLRSPLLSPAVPASPLTTHAAHVTCAPAGQGLDAQDRGHRGVVWAAAGGGCGGRAAGAAS